MPEPLRFRLVLGKFRVSRTTSNALNTTFTLDLGNSIKMTLDVPPYADVREGDLLTLYTEILSHANPQQPPVQ